MDGDADKFLDPTDAAKALKCSKSTLIRWAKEGKIQYRRATVKGKRYYNVSHFIKTTTSGKDAEAVQAAPPAKPRRKICYCRVSSAQQQPDLVRQEKFLTERYPGYEVIRDIGSGLNFKRAGLQAILDAAIRGEIEEVVVAHRDRLCRFGFELIETLIKKCSNGKIVVHIHHQCTPQEELVNDILSIITVFSARLNGLRKYKTSIQKEYNTNGDEENQDVPQQTPVADSADVGSSVQVVLQPNN